jgi:hypothetical protein
MKESNFGEIDVTGVVSEKIDLYVKLFGKNKSPVIINDEQGFFEIKSCGDPDNYLSATMINLCGEIDSNRGDREETEEDKKFCV